jgi:protein-L-isoaspartate(D-aspartate) O-methyltransferase
MDWAKARALMVEGQVRPNKVTDPRIVEAMLALPREALVPGPRQALAYADVPVPVADGRALLAPMVVARMVQEARPVAGERALALPGAAGYGAALLARLGLAVTLLETAEHQAAAMSAMRALGASVTHATGALANGVPDTRLFDLILVEGALPAPPPGLLGQLAEGGRLLAILAGPGTGQAVRVDRRGGADTLTKLFDAAAPGLPDFAAAPVFAL